MSSSATIYLIQRINIWEAYVSRGDEVIGNCTAPTMAGVFDIAYDIIAEDDPEWADFNANEDL